MNISEQMNRFVKIGGAAEILGVCVQTLRRREKSGQPVPDRKTGGGTRYYDRDRLIGLKKNENKLPKYLKYQLSLIEKVSSTAFRLSGV